MHFMLLSEKYADGLRLPTPEVSRSLFCGATRVRLRRFCVWRAHDAPSCENFGRFSRWLEIHPQAKVADANTLPVGVKSCAPRSLWMSTPIDLDNEPVPR
jgi:hypothetical protein